MLPILRILPVGGVFLAIMIVLLALEPPGAKRPTLTPARGPLIAADAHPEWRQFLIQAAVRRADELGRLRELPDTPTRIDGAPVPEVAGLPGSDGDPNNDQTGAISETPTATIPVDIGETSLFELPVAAPEQRPPVIKPPQRKAPSASRKQPPRRSAHRARTAPKTQIASPSDPFAALFGGQRSQQPTAQNGSAPPMAGADPH
jgi:hypothetical protein